MDINVFTCVVKQGGHDWYEDLDFKNENKRENYIKNKNVTFPWKKPEYSCSLAPKEAPKGDF